MPLKHYESSKNNFMAHDIIIKKFYSMIKNIS